MRGLQRTVICLQQTVAGYKLCMQRCHMLSYQAETCKALLGGRHGDAAQNGAGTLDGLLQEG